MQCVDVTRRFCCVKKFVENCHLKGSRKINNSTFACTPGLWVRFVIICDNPGKITLIERYLTHHIPILLK